MKHGNIIYIQFILFIISFHISAQNSRDTELVSLINELRLSESNLKSNRLIKKCIKLNAEFNEVSEIIKSNIKYPTNIKTGYNEWKYKIDSLEYTTILFIPSNYTPQKKYPVSFILHGAASSFNSEAVKKYVNRYSYNCDSLEKILVYPGCWIESIWWKEKQNKNLRYLLKKIKTLYNIDENNIHLAGISDGGTGIIYQANLDITPWAGFRPYISNPSGLRTLSNRDIFIGNLGNRPFLFISSENDHLFPPYLMESFLKKMDKAENTYKYFLAPGYDHEISWLPLYKDTIINFLKNYPRDPFPDRLFWQTNDLKYNRIHWVMIDKLKNNEQIDNEIFPVIKPANSKSNNPSGLIQITTSNNKIEVKTINIKQYTLLLSPEQFDFDKEIEVYTNKELSFKGKIEKNVSVLLKWYNNDIDRTMLFGNEITIDL